MNKPPLYFVAVPLALGIMVERELTIVVVVLLGLLIALNWSKWLPMLIFTLLGFMLGAISEHHNEIPYDQPVEVVVRVETTPLIKGRWQISSGDVLAYKLRSVQKMDPALNSDWTSTRQKMQLYVDTSAQISLGNTLMMNTKQRAFDSVYAPYYLNRGVTGRAFGYRVQTIESDTTLLEQVRLWSGRLSQKIAEINTTSENIALMQAIALGDKSRLDPEQRHENVRAGTAHILAVSGLHVGIIFMALSLALGWIKLFRRGIEVFSIVIIACLWVYAAVTGFSPSVLRAVVMFTMYQLGVIISRESNNFNTLLGAGLILLLCDANYLFDIGFQLSFVAMFGIVALYRPIYLVWPNRFWSLVAISLAAQIAVLPLSCYYFGNIPFFGIFSNIALWLVVPTVIILTMIYLITEIGFIADAAAWAAGLYNDFVSMTSDQSWVAIEGVSMPQWLCLAIYAAMVAIIAVWGSDKSKILKLNLKRK